METLHFTGIRIFFGFLFLCYYSGFSQEWKEIPLSNSGTSASSELADPNQDEEMWFYNNKYGSQNLFDGDYTTAWVEGAEGSGIGEHVYVVIPDDCRTVNIFGGYGKNVSLWEMNNRVKRLKLTCYIGIHAEGFVTEVVDVYKSLRYPSDFYINLEDAAKLQTFPFPFNAEQLGEFRQQVIDRFKNEYGIPIESLKTILQLEIVDVYKGSKYDDTCISVLYFSDSFVFDNRRLVHKKVDKVFVDETSESRILVDTPERKGITLKEDLQSVFQISEVSSNNIWVTVIQMPAEVGEGRIETIYLLMNTLLGRVMNAEIEIALGKPLFGPLFLSEREGKTILEHSDGEIWLR